MKETTDDLEYLNYKSPLGQTEPKLKPAAEVRTCFLR